MRTTTLGIIAALLATPAIAQTRITGDGGGGYLDYQGRVGGVRGSGGTVIIDGPCYSACTLYLRLPRSQVCATPRAVLMFHMANESGGALPGIPSIRSSQATNEIYNSYPPSIRIWIGKRGGLWLKPLYMRAPEIFRHIRRC